MADTAFSIEKHLNIESNDTNAITVLAENCPEISKQKLKLAMQLGAVWLTRANKTDRLRRAKKILQSGDTLHLYFDELKLFSKIKSAQLVADAGEYSVWDKPCGMFSQGSKWGDHTAICRWIELNGFAQNNLPLRPCFLVHRLDRATSGLIIIAHSKKMASKLSALFESRKVDKHYRAIVAGKFSGLAVKQKIQQDIEGKFASTQLLDIEYDSTYDQSCLLLKLETGRKHQLRKHLSQLGFPIIGDRLYGQSPSDAFNSSSKNLSDLPDLQLRSCYLAFESPIDQQYYRYSLDYPL